MWIKVTVNGAAEWVNCAHVRRIQYGRAGQCQIVYTTKDIITVDQSLESVMEALGYKQPPPPKLETYALGHEDERAEFAHTDGGEE